jgi:hypothetical protein
MMCVASGYDLYAQETALEKSNDRSYREESMQKAEYIGTGREVFWDDFLIEKTEADFRLTVPEKREIVMTFNRPWEGNICGYFQVLNDGEKFRIYYFGGNLQDEESTHDFVRCMLTSRDGIHWERPELGLVEFEGSKKNNIVMGHTGNFSEFPANFFVFVDTNPACRPEERFKAISEGGDRGEFTPRPEEWAKGGLEYRALWGYTSPDGIHWNKMPQSPLLKKGRFDSLNTASWDSFHNEYRVYYRDVHPWNGPPRPKKDLDVRDVRLATSKDFIHWNDDRTILRYGDAPDEELYTNGITPYYRAPHILVGFPTRYIQRNWEPMFEQLPNPEYRRERSEKDMRSGTAVTDGLFMTSRDGLNFHRWDEPFLTPGIARKHNWVYGDCYQSHGLIETVAEDPEAPPEISFFVGEDYGSKTRLASLRRYTVRLDGFACLHAAREPKTVVTRPLIFDGKTLTLNMGVSAAGYVMVEFLDSDGNPIPGFSGIDACKMFGDDISLKALFRRGESATGDVSSLAGKPVKIRFTLCEARLYAMQFV